MTTIQQIKLQLSRLTAPDQWLEELKEDERKGVQLAVRQWIKQYEKKQQDLAALMEKQAFDDRYKPAPDSCIAGIDEAGRGPLAGPVVTAAVILGDDPLELVGLDDSKKISKDRREELAKKIKEQALAYAIHIQPASVIDEQNIYRATKLSMERAAAELTIAPDIVLADAMQLDTPVPAVSIIKGDEQSLAIAAASILAKTTRDALMLELHEQYPQYHFNSNAGYGTAQHLEALQQYGVCEHHRLSFEPIKSNRQYWREDT